MYADVSKTLQCLGAFTFALTVYSNTLPYLRRSFTYFLPKTAPQVGVDEWCRRDPGRACIPFNPSKPQ
jgi:hypothetical protein